MPAKLMRAHKMVGTKQTLKALEAGRAELVYIAKDADTEVTNPVRESWHDWESRLWMSIQWQN